MGPAGRSLAGHFDRPLIHALQPSAPGAFVKDQKEAAEYYANRVIKDYKDK